MTIENVMQVHITDDKEIECNNLIKSLVKNNEICFKNQQKWETDLTQEEKFEIGAQLFKNCKLQFLVKFGKYLKYPQLEFFRKQTEHEPDFEEINILINDLQKSCKHNAKHVVKNRRYQAMVQMIQNSSYFSEVEMMKRNPLLYNQLIGQHLTREEIKERDKYNLNNQTSFVKILMEGIERENAEKVKQQQEEIENNQMEEDEDDLSDSEQKYIPRPSTSHWGEFMDSKKTKPFDAVQTSTIIPEEKKLLKDEFVTTMYESFLDGKDEDFDYENIDNNTSYDDIDQLNNDEEEKYFASEEANEHYIINS